MSAIETLVRRARLLGSTPVRYVEESPLAKRVKRAFGKDPTDLYYRSALSQYGDKLFGVSQHQLDVRYGLVKHKVVPKVHTPDYVDYLEDWLDTKLSWIISPHHYGIPIGSKAHE